MNLEKIQNILIVAIISAIVSILCMRYFPQQEYIVDMSAFVRIADYEFLLDTDENMSEHERTQILNIYEEEVARVAREGYLVLDGRHIHSAPQKMLITLPNPEVLQ